MYCVVTIALQIIAVVILIVLTNDGKGPHLKPKLDPH